VIEESTKDSWVQSQGRAQPTQVQELREPLMLERLSSLAFTQRWKCFPVHSKTTTSLAQSSRCHHFSHFRLSSAVEARASIM
jgi:hypothetical protein